MPPRFFLIWLSLPFRKPRSELRPRDFSSRIRAEKLRRVRVSARFSKTGEPYLRRSRYYILVGEHPATFVDVWYPPTNNFPNHAHNIPHDSVTPRFRDFKFFLLESKLNEPLVSDSKSRHCRFQAVHLLFRCRNRDGILLVHGLFLLRFFRQVESGTCEVGKILIVLTVDVLPIL